MLLVTFSRLKAKTEELLAEEQAGFRLGWSTAEQIFNGRVIIEKHLQHQRDLFHYAIHFKKAFDRIWHAGLWQVLRSFNIEEEMFQAIQALYENSSSVILLSSQLEELFKQQYVSVRDAYSHPFFSTCSYRRSCRKHTMTTTHSSPLVEGP